MEQQTVIKETLKEYGVEFIIDPNFKPEGSQIYVECDLDVNLNLPWVNDCVLTKLTKRNTKMHCRFKQTEEKLIIIFSTKASDDYLKFVELKPSNIFTTFVDMCWLYSEGTTAVTINEVETKPRAEYNPGDITWLMPSKFADDVIEMIHTINPEFMSGLMQDAIVYGPFINSQNS